MGAIPADVDAEQGPPTAVPLAHFLAALGFLLAGTAVLVAGPAGRSGHLAAVHLLLAGWVCVTIMGAMTQFVPVWSGVGLHSRRLAVWQLWLAAPGFAGLAASFLTGRLALAPVAGGVAAVGVWLFAYNVGRTLAAVDEPGVTERHFAVALACFVAVALLGPVLAADLTCGVLPVAGVGHVGVLRAHATLAVFGAVLATVAGALYQLATMFTQTELGPIERRFRDVETVAYPVGVGLLALGRLLSTAALSRAGGVLVAASIAGLGLVVANRLRTTRVEPNPMLVRYGVVAAFAVAWAATALVGWWGEPLGALYGHPTAGAPLLAGLVGFVVAGTLYHVVPFLVWVREYSDLLGLEDVPLIDDLYDGRLARVELALVLGGGALLAVDRSTAVAASLPWAGRAGGALLAAGALLFATNLALVVVRHGEFSTTDLLGVGG
ncbi:hypothetical protein [Halomicrobium salinisoli]|uniref:hypothetical protein n=1 Tax=Halomicrobium salinisoli TaxID=2878391 RepID=UPI001CF05B6F|nr:hypothetical protein [Halomicrobium salinisoli]